MESAMVFTRCEEFVNVARISPNLLVMKPPVINKPHLRINVAADTSANATSQVAICVSPGMATECFLVQPHPGSGSAPRMRSYMSLMFHNQEWERWEAVMCLCFGESCLYTPMTKFAVHMGSILGPPGTSSTTKGATYLIFVIG
jgi:hypothetical protein